MGAGRRVEALLARDRGEEARAALERAEAEGDDAYLALLGVWLRAAPKGPGHVTAALEGWAAPPEGDPDGPRVRCLRAALEAREALHTGNAERLTRQVQAALAALPDDSVWLAFVTAGILQAAFRMTGVADQARETLALCGRVGDRTDHPELAVQARALAGTVHLLLGRFHLADDRLASSLELARATGLEGGSETGMTLQFQGYLRYEWNRLDEARSLLERAGALGEARGSRGVLSGSYRMLVQVSLAQGRIEEGRRWLERLEALLSGPQSQRNREWLGAVRAGFLAATGELQEAADAVRALGYRPGEVAAAEVPWMVGRLMETATLLDVQGALARWEELLPVAARLAEVAGGAERRWFAVRARAWEAAAFEALGESEAAEASVAALASTVGEEGYVRVLADVGAPLIPPLERFLAGAGARGHGALARALEATRHAVRGEATRPSLTPREAQVLALVARGRSTKAIARELGISMATVKTHLHHLYRKLDVSSRTQALARAEALALL